MMITFVEKPHQCISRDDRSCIGHAVTAPDNDCPTEAGYGWSYYDEKADHNKYRRAEEGLTVKCACK